MIRWVLLVSILVTVALYFIPHGHYIAYPLLLISTLVHELGHGLTSLVTGGVFEKFIMNPDASGAALTATSSWWQSVLVSAGGLLGPAFVSGICFFAARSSKASKWTLFAAGVFLVIIEIVFVRNAFGLAFVGFLAVLLLAGGHFLKPEWSRLVVAFLGVQLALSVFSRSDYLFVKFADVGGERLPSDVQRIAAEMGLPYWFWGIVMGLISVAILAVGVRALLRSAK